MKSVLIVNNNLNQRLSLKAMLEKNGYQCKEAENGAMALAMVLTNCLDLVLVELDAPLVHGFELLTHMAKRELLSTIPFIGITNYHSKMLFKLIHLAGAYATVTKPIEFHDLLGKVTRAIKSGEEAEIPSPVNTYNYVY